MQTQESSRVWKNEIAGRDVARIKQKLKKEAKWNKYRVKREDSRKWKVNRSSNANVNLYFLVACPSFEKYVLAIRSLENRFSCFKLNREFNLKRSRWISQIKYWYNRKSFKSIKGRGLTFRTTSDR